jgi:hypothetical protein
MSMIRQVFGEERMSSRWKTPNSPRPKNAKQVKSKVKNVHIIFFDLRGLFTRSSSWKAKQSILRTILTFYGDCVKIYEDFAAKFGDKCFLLHHDKALSFQGILTIVPHPPYFSSPFPRLKIKLKGRHFDTTEVIEADSQAALNTLTEHDFQEEFKMAEALGKVNMR